MQAGGEYQHDDKISDFSGTSAAVDKLINNNANVRERREKPPQRVRKERSTTMTLIELHNTLGDRIEMALKKDLTPEERETENAQSALVCELAKQIINNGDLILRSEKLAAMNRSLEESAAMHLIYGDRLKKNE